MLYELVTKVHQLHLRKNAGGGFASDGYLLPVVIVLGMAVSIVSMMALQLVAQNSLTLNSQYYSELAIEAAQSGVAAATKCIEAGQVDWGNLNNNRKPSLTPKTDCDGNDQSNRQSTITSDGNVDASYVVSGLQDPYGNNTRIIMSTGTVSVKGPGGVKIESFSETVRTFGLVASSTGTSSKQVNQISTGGDTTCAVAETDAYCWGSNLFGQIGAGNVGNQNIPVAVSRKVMTGAVTKISVGKTHTCAVAGGKAYCWGLNLSGQLGNNSILSTDAPVAVDTSGVLSAKVIIDIQAGDSFTCALASDGTTACWGMNNNGQLGNNSNTDSHVPSPIYRSVGGTPTPSPPPGVCVWTISIWCLLHWTPLSVYPPSVKPGDPAPQSPLYNKIVTGLGRPKGSTMCVTAVDIAGPITTGSGSPYCWGKNIPVPQGTNFPTNTGCGSNSPLWPYATVNNSFTIPDSNQPTLMPGGKIVKSASMTIGDNLNALDGGGIMYHWSTGSEQIMIHSYATSNCTIWFFFWPTTYANLRYDTTYSTVGATVTQPYGSTIMGLATGDTSTGLVCYTQANTPMCDRNGSITLSGQTGSGLLNPPDNPVPVVLDGATGLGSTQLPITDMDSGNNHVCVIADTQAFCWGDGFSGQLGNNTFNNYSLVPVAVDAAGSAMSNRVATLPTFNNPVSF